MSIKVSLLRQAISEARRFIDAAETADACGLRDEYVKGDPIYRGGQFTASLKRASMDLTKILARIRRGV